MEKQNDGLSNIQRVLNQLDKASDRLNRQNYFNNHQKDPLFDQIELAIETMRQQIRNFRVFKELNSFYIAQSPLHLGDFRIDKFSCEKSRSG